MNEEMIKYICKKANIPIRINKDVDTGKPFHILQMPNNFEESYLKSGYDKYKKSILIDAMINTNAESGTYTLSIENGNAVQIHKKDNSFTEYSPCFDFETKVEDCIYRQLEQAFEWIKENS